MWKYRKEVLENANDWERLKIAYQNSDIGTMKFLILVKHKFIKVPCSNCKAGAKLTLEFIEELFYEVG